MIGFLKLLPTVLSIIKLILERVNFERARQVGWNEALAAGLAASLQAIQDANDAEREVAARHKADSTDSAFDQEFKRED